MYKRYTRKINGHYIFLNDTKVAKRLGEFENIMQDYEIESTEHLRNILNDYFYGEEKWKNRK